MSKKDGFVKKPRENRFKTSENVNSFVTIKKPSKENRLKLKLEQEEKSEIVNRKNEFIDTKPTSDICNLCKFGHNLNWQIRLLKDNYDELEKRIVLLIGNDELSVSEIVKVENLKLKYLKQINKLWNDIYQIKQVSGAVKGASVNVQLNQQFTGPTNYKQHRSLAKNLVGGIDEINLLDNVSESEHGQCGTKVGNCDKPIDNFDLIVSDQEEY